MGELTWLQRFIIFTLVILILSVLAFFILEMYHDKGQLSEVVLTVAIFSGVSFAGALYLQKEEDKKNGGG